MLGGAAKSTSSVPTKEVWHRVLEALIDASHGVLFPSICQFRLALLEKRFCAEA